MLFHSVTWLKQDDGTEYVPLVGKLEHMFNSVVTPRSDMNFGSKGSMRNLLNGSKAHIGRWRKGRRERCPSASQHAFTHRPLLQKCIKKILPLREGADCSALRRVISFMGGRRAEKACR